MLVSIIQEKVTKQYSFILVDIYKNRKNMMIRRWHTLSVSQILTILLFKSKMLVEECGKLKTYTVSRKREDASMLLDVVNSPSDENLLCKLCCNE